MPIVKTTTHPTVLRPHQARMSRPSQLPRKSPHPRPPALRRRASRRWRRPATGQKSRSCSRGCSTPRAAQLRRQGTQDEHGTDGLGDVGDHEDARLGAGRAGEHVQRDGRHRDEGRREPPPAAHETRPNSSIAAPAAGQTRLSISPSAMVARPSSRARSTQQCRARARWTASTRRDPRSLGSGRGPRPARSTAFHHSWLGCGRCTDLARRHSERHARARVSGDRGRGRRARDAVGVAGKEQVLDVAQPLDLADLLAGWVRGCRSAPRRTAWSRTRAPRTRLVTGVAQRPRHLLGADPGLVVVGHHDAPRRGPARSGRAIAAGIVVLAVEDAPGVRRRGRRRACRRCRSAPARPSGPGSPRRGSW